MSEIIDFRTRKKIKPTDIERSGSLAQMRRDLAHQRISQLIDMSTVDKCGFVFIHLRPGHSNPVEVVIDTEDVDKRMLAQCCERLRDILSE